MTTTSNDSLIGFITDVQPGCLVVSLSDSSQGDSPQVTIGDEDILVGQVGSYVLIKQGAHETLAVVSRMTEQEKLVPLEGGGDTRDDVRTSIAVRTMTRPL